MDAENSLLFNFSDIFSMRVQIFVAALMRTAIGSGADRVTDGAGTIVPPLHRGEVPDAANVGGPSDGAPAVDEVFRIEAKYSAFSGLVASLRIGTEPQEVLVSLGFRSIQPGLFTGAACPAFVTCFDPAASTTFRVIPGSKAMTVGHAVFGDLRLQSVLDKIEIGGFTIAPAGFLNLMSHTYSAPLLREVGGMFGLARTSAFFTKTGSITVETTPADDGLVLHGTKLPAAEIGSFWSVAPIIDQRGEWSFEAQVSVNRELLPGDKSVVILDPGSESIKMATGLGDRLQKLLLDSGIAAYYAHGRLFISCEPDAEEEMQGISFGLRVTDMSNESRELVIPGNALMFPPQVRRLYMQDAPEADDGQSLCPLRLEVTDALPAGRIVAGRPVMSAVDRLVLTNEAIRILPRQAAAIVGFPLMPVPRVPVFGFPTVVPDPGHAEWNILRFARSALAEESRVFILRNIGPQPYGRGFMMTFLRVNPEDHARTAWGGNRKIYTSADLEGEPESLNYDPSQPGWEIPLIPSHFDTPEHPIQNRFLVQIFEDQNGIQVYLTYEPIDAALPRPGERLAEPTIEDMELPPPIEPNTRNIFSRTRSLTPAFSGADLELEFSPRGSAFGRAGSRGLPAFDLSAAFRATLEAERAHAAGSRADIDHSGDNVEESGLGDLPLFRPGPPPSERPGTVTPILRHAGAGSTAPAFDEEQEDEEEENERSPAAREPNATPSQASDENEATFFVGYDEDEEELGHGGLGAPLRGTGNSAPSTPTARGDGAGLDASPTQSPMLRLGAIRALEDPDFQSPFGRWIRQVATQSPTTVQIDGNGSPGELPEYNGDLALEDDEGEADEEAIVATHGLTINPGATPRAGNSLGRTLSFSHHVPPTEPPAYVTPTSRSSGGHFGFDRSRSGPVSRNPIETTFTSPAGGAGMATRSSGSHGSLRALSPAEECAICTTAMSTADRLQRIAGCSHLFHHACIKHWLEKSQRNCPLCRNVVRLKPKQGYIPKEGPLEF